MKKMLYKRCSKFKLFSPLHRNHRLRPSSSDGNSVQNKEVPEAFLDYSPNFKSHESCILDRPNLTVLDPVLGLYTEDLLNTSLLSDDVFYEAEEMKEYISISELPNEVVEIIFSFLSTTDLSRCAQVCKRFEYLAWIPSFWRFITIDGKGLSADVAIQKISKQFIDRNSILPWKEMRKFSVTSGAKISEKSLLYLCGRCPNLIHLKLHDCPSVNNYAVFHFVTVCYKLQKIDLSGCKNISCISSILSGESRNLFFKHIDLTDCIGVQDSGLVTIVRNCAHLESLHLAGCRQITDLGINYLGRHCSKLRQLSMDDCSQITDQSLHSLKRLSGTLIDLSLSNCFLLSDLGLIAIARRCKLRNLNLSGCFSITDYGIIRLAELCTTLVSLNIGNTMVSDPGLCTIAEFCPLLRYLILKNCFFVTQRGIHYLAFYNTHLRHLNIEGCPIPKTTYKVLQKYCKYCTIEYNVHT